MYYRSKKLINITAKRLSVLPIHMKKALIRFFGVILLLLGIVGFFSNSIIGPTGYFYATAGMSVVNLLAGIILLAVSGEEARAGLWLKIAGVVYFIVAVIGFAITAAGGVGNVLGFMGVNMAANWLYAIAGILMFGSGFVENKGSVMLHAKSHA